MRVYVGNIPFSCTEDQIRDAFAPFGAVTRVDMIRDFETQRPKGFAFVDMDDDGAESAIDSLNGTDLGGRRMVVSRAKERERKQSGSRFTWER